MWIIVSLAPGRAQWIIGNHGKSGNSVPDEQSDIVGTPGRGANGGRLIDGPLRSRRRSATPGTSFKWPLRRFPRGSRASSTRIPAMEGPRAQQRWFRPVDAGRRPAAGSSAAPAISAEELVACYG
jgi:hypothetical protein